MQINLPEEVVNIIEKFQEKKFEIYIVGGAIRDIMLGKIVSDWDFTTNATPEQIQELFPESFYDNKFGTVGIASTDSDLDPYEITTFRTESSYSDNRRPDKVEWGESLEEDLKRRDFTINAMAINPSNELIDPYNGQKDLKNKTIRAVGDAHERFNEDALRMMRAIRIAAQLKFEIEEKTWEALKVNVNLIEKIAKERIKDELFKIVASDNPDHGIMRLKESGLMHLILPEMEKAFGVEQKSPERHHIYDVGTHCVMALKYCRSNDPIVRFATLIHDIGKPVTFKVNEKKVITFYNHEVVGAHIAKRIAERLRFSNKESERLYKLVRWHQFSVGEGQTDSAIRRFIHHVGVENINDMLDLRVADRLGGGASETSWRLEEFKNRLIEVQKQPFSVKDLKIDGADVMKELNIKPGPKVGEILKILFDEVVEKKIENEKKVLLQRLKTIN